MARVSRCLMFAAAVAVSVPATPRADAVRVRYTAPRHYRYPAGAYPYRSPGVILTEVASLPFYGTFGGFEDTYWAARYPGPVERRYYGYGWDPRLRF